MVFDEGPVCYKFHLPFLEEFIAHLEFDRAVQFPLRQYCDELGVADNEISEDSGHLFGGGEQLVVGGDVDEIEVLGFEEVVGVGEESRDA